MEKFVRIRGPGGGTSTVTRRAYDEVWAAKGYELADEAAPPPRDPDPVEPDPDPDPDPEAEAGEPEPDPDPASAPPVPKSPARRKA